MRAVTTDRRELADRRRKMVDYLDLKRHEQDWHAVWDAAVDLETLDARMILLDAIEQEMRAKDDHPD